jgi:predicted HicB family RNase H-like nuclease
MERKKTGRPPKGERTLVNFRVPPTLHQAAKERAQEQGMTMNDFLGELLSAELGVPYQSQEGLPLTKAS